jgi:hypothetical protein
MKGAPLLSDLKRSFEEARKAREKIANLSTPTLSITPVQKKGLEEPKEPLEFKVTVLKKGHPDYERFLALGNQLINNVETALDEIHQELQRLAGRVSRSDYDWENVIDYVEFYSLDTKNKKLKIEEVEEEDDEDDSSSYS